MATFTSKYGTGETVYLRVAEEQQRGMVTAVQFQPGAAAMYQVIWSTRQEAWHYEIELTSEFVPDFVKDTEKKA